MAHRFEKGKSIYFLFKNGHTVQDSQLKPRYYLDRKKAEEYLPYGDEIVEYVPANLRTKGEWIYNTDDFTPKKRCTNCGYNKPLVAGEAIKQEPDNYCPNCGADMRGETHDS